MVAGELLFRFMNVMLLTALVAPLVLWRYRRAVLAGMATKVGTAMPLAPPLGAKPRQTAASLAGAAARLAWEAHMRRRVVVAVVAALFPPALLLAAHYVVVNELPVTPAHLSLYAGTATLMAVPMIGVLAAIRFTRTLVLGVVLLCAFAAISVAISMLQRPFFGKAPTLDQLLNFFNFVGFAADHAVAAARARGGDRRTASARRRALRLRRPARVRGRAAARRSPHDRRSAPWHGARAGCSRAGSTSARSSSRCRSACSPGGGSRRSRAATKRNAFPTRSCSPTAGG